MRSLLGGWSPAVVSVFVAVELLACPRVAAPQSKETAPARPQGAAMRSVVQTASNGEVALDRRVSARLDSAQGVLFDGRYAEAIDECLKAITVDSSFGNPYNDIGSYLIAQGDLWTCVRWFRRALGAARDGHCRSVCRTSHAIACPL